MTLGCLSDIPVLSSMLDTARVIISCISLTFQFALQTQRFSDPWLGDSGNAVQCITPLQRGTSWETGDSDISLCQASPALVTTGGNWQAPHTPDKLWPAGSRRPESQKLCPHQHFLHQQGKGGFVWKSELKKEGKKCNCHLIRGIVHWLPGLW